MEGTMGQGAGAVLPLHWTDDRLRVRAGPWWVSVPGRGPQQ